MRKLTRLLLLLAAFAALVPDPTPSVQADDADQFKPLFNGKDLDGWDTWLGKPYRGEEAVG